MVRLLLIVFASLPMVAFAAQFRVRVVDGVTKEPLARDQIRIEARTIAAITDSSGRFVIDTSVNRYLLAADYHHRLSSTN